MGNVLSEELAAQSHLHGKPVKKHKMATLEQAKCAWFQILLKQLNQAQHTLTEQNGTNTLIYETSNRYIRLTQCVSNNL
jgi:hypothetical protein